MHHRALMLIAAAVLAPACVTMRPTPAPEPQVHGQGHGQESVWVCHGGKNPKWRRVSAAAADAHRRHGDFVTAEPQESGQRCDPALRGPDHREHGRGNT